jgi:hypothetical protein
MKRREFLMTAAAGAAAVAGLPHPVRGQAADRARQAKLDRIAVMTLNFQSILRVPDVPSTPERTLELFDIGEMLADTYGVHRIEFQHYHLASTEPAYLKDLRNRLAKTKSQATQINLEFGELNMSAPTTRNRLLAIDLTKAFVEHARNLGAQRVMINQGQPTHVNKAVGIPVLKTMTDFGKARGVIVSVETRGGGGGRGGRGGRGRAGGAAPPPPPPGLPDTPRGRWELLAEIMKAAGSYSNVDVGGAGAPNQQELHDCIRAMFPFTAGSMHTRTNQNWDLATCVRFMEGELGWKGLYTVEQGGHEGTKQVYDVLMATL